MARYNNKVLIDIEAYKLFICIVLLFFYIKVISYGSAFERKRSNTLVLEKYTFSCNI